MGLFDLTAILNSAARAVTKLQNSITLLLLISNHFTGSKLRNACIQYKILSLTYKSLQYNKPSSISLIFSPYNQLVLPAHLQLSLSNALQIPLGSNFLTDLSTFKRLHFGMPYTTPSSLSFSFFSISFSSLTIFLSIPQATENSPFSSFLSSLAYLLSTGLQDGSLFSFIGIFHYKFIKFISLKLFFGSAQLMKVSARCQ